MNRTRFRGALVSIIGLVAAGAVGSCATNQDGGTSSGPSSTTGRTTATSGTQGGTATAGAATGAAAGATASAGASAGATATGGATGATSAGATATAGATSGTAGGATASAGTGSATASSTTGATTASSTGATTASSSTGATTASATTGASTATSGAGTTGGGAAVSCTTTTPASSVTPKSATITNFSPPDDAGTKAPGGVDSSGAFGNDWPFVQPVGNFYVYPAIKHADYPACTPDADAAAPVSPMKSSLDRCDNSPTPGVFTISGTVATYSGFGLALWCPVDASMYRGVQFDIGGNVGPTGTMSFSVTTCSDLAQTACVTGTKTITVTSGVSTVSALWSELMPPAAAAAAAINPQIITGIGWGFGWYYPEDSGAPYSASVTLDNLAWLP